MTVPPAVPAAPPVAVPDSADAPAQRRCRNCDAPIAGHYCANCGQETRITLPTFNTFMREAAGRYVALDGRTWRTLWGLVARPGFLTLEYLQGRRRRYIRPARLFLVLYLLLFALIGLLQSPADVAQQVVFVNSDDHEKATKTEAADPGKPKVNVVGPTVVKKRPAAAADPAQATAADPAASSTFVGVDDDLDVVLRLGGLEAKLPEPLQRRYEHFKKLPREEKAEQLYAGMLRFGTYAMVALLPAFALLLKLAYLGRGSRYPGRPQRYAEHLVYSAHMHAFAALTLVLLLVLPYAPVKAAVAFWIVFYVMRARQRVYRGRWWGGLLRSLVIALCYLVLVAVAITGLLAAAVMLR
ncbi:MAG: DUF3667 domain-containing protein [Burkholderiales bacterium]